MKRAQCDIIQQKKNRHKIQRALAYDVQWDSFLYRNVTSCCVCWVELTSSGLFTNTMVVTMECQEREMERQRRRTSHTETLYSKADIQNYCCSAVGVVVLLIFILFLFFFSFKLKLEFFFKNSIIFSNNSVYSLTIVSSPKKAILNKFPIDNPKSKSHNVSKFTEKSECRFAGYWEYVFDECEYCNTEYIIAK